jgi:hypothetical protein
VRLNRAHAFHGGERLGGLLKYYSAAA